MRQIMFMAAIVVAIAVVAARMVDQAGRNAGPPAAAAATAPQPTYDSSSVVVPRDARGQFVVDARVDGRRLQFMLDTGASLVALKARDAAMLGIHPGARDFTVEVKTANGVTRAARVELGLVEVSGLNVRNVTALVSPDEALSENLLGLSFLSRLRRFEYSNGRMVLEQ
jgi:aspartyl protease family protein